MLSGMLPLRRGVFVFLETIEAVVDTISEAYGSALGMRVGTADLKPPVISSFRSWIRCSHICISSGAMLYAREFMTLAF